MSILWMFGIPFAGLFDLRFISTLSQFASPSLPAVMAMLAVLAVSGLMARHALNY